ESAAWGEGWSAEAGMAKTENSNVTIYLTAIGGRVTLTFAPSCEGPAQHAVALAEAVRAVPAAHLPPNRGPGAATRRGGNGGSFAHARIVPAGPAGRRRRCAVVERRTARSRQICPRTRRSRAAGRAVDRVVGHHLLQALVVPSHSIAKQPIPRNFSAQYKIF